MGLPETIEHLYERPDETLSLTYRQIQALDMDLGVKSEMRDGRDFHTLTAPVTVSVQRMRGSHLTNLIFTSANPLRLEFDEEEVLEYYSDYIEIRHIVEGALSVDFEGLQETFTAGQVCFINSTAYHREIIGTGDCTYLNIGIERALFTEAFLGGIGLTPLQRYLRENVMRGSREDAFLRFEPNDTASQTLVEDELEAIVREARWRQVGYLDICRGHIIRLMDQLSREFQLGLALSDTDTYYETLFQSVTEFMLDNLADVTLPDLVREFHFQPNFFNNLIKRVAGVTYSAYLIRLRIDRAQQLLETSNLPVEEIAQLVGYSNKGFFYQKFTEACGVSPATYRKSLKKA